MYDASDPRAALAAARSAPAPSAFAGAEIGRFHAEPPQEDGPEGRTWYLRGQNFLVAHTEARPGAVLRRQAQPDEYVLLLMRPDTPARITAGGQVETVPGHSLVIVPPGDSGIALPEGGAVTRLFSTRSADLAARCANAESYAAPHPNIPPFEPWPAPPDGFRIRAYPLDVPPEPGRFGRIFRCTTLMINLIDPMDGPRDIRKLSPHHHDDFEQGSLALDGSFTHHLRWPWTPDMTTWREDAHVECGSPSLIVIPPPAIHTSRGTDAGLNQLVDIFSPPRRDFSEKPGWVLNAADYPMPR
ncbi:hypothetical protein M0638_18110 [Roseomonas sp. NAR14]|uniref:Uncharacterized protein n=1 Tax=Roseomonas acroporae TaxID=2937791 RepID=A0A9X1YAU3_9PROT|nr:hypothetical protein [Roseomonas acroporae]MCK8786295.1 hypothetical protein [Roseomonas acroporae]